jgi:tetratricopeptide (TPR) repeat protein
MRCSLAILIVAVLGTSIAHADKVPVDTQAKADGLFERAQANYEANQFQAAIELFKQAYDLVHDPIYLFNLAQSYRRVLDCEAAYDYYHQYLDAAPKADNKAKVLQWLTELQPCVEQRQKEHEAARKGEEAERLRREEEDRKRRAALAPQETLVDHGGTLRLAGVITIGVGSVGVAVGALYSVKGSNLKSDLATACMAGCRWDDPAIRQLDTDGQHANTIAKIGYIGGGITALVGAGLYVFGRSRVEHVMISPAEGGATVTARLRF